MRIRGPVAIAHELPPADNGSREDGMPMTAAAVDGSVPAAYRHHRRLITPGAPLPIGRTDLKWYEIRRPDAPMPAGLEDETRTFLKGEVEAGRLDIEGQPG